PFEPGAFVLVYERELEIDDPEDNAASVDRGIRYVLPLNVEHPPEDMLVVDDLLFATIPSEGLAVVRISEPERPSMVKFIDQFVSREGAVLSPNGMKLLGVEQGVLYLSVGGHVVAVDARRPQMAQLGAMHEPRQSSYALFDGQPMVMATDGRTVQQIAFEPPATPSFFRRSEPLGFTLGAGESDAAYSLALVYGADNVGVFAVDDHEAVLIDGTAIGDPRNPVSAAGCITNGVADVLEEALLTRDGLVLARMPQCLLLSQTELVDLASSSPAHGQRGVPTDHAITLTLTQPMTSLELGGLAHYIELVKRDALSQETPVELELGLFPEGSTQSRTLALQPVQGDPAEAIALDVNQEYCIKFSSEVGAFRSSGLFNREVCFHTTSSVGHTPAPELVAVEPPFVPVQGGDVAVVAKVHGALEEHVALMIAGQGVEVTGSEAIDSTTTRFTIAVPSDQIPGPASVTVRNTATGAEDERLGALAYLEPLTVDAVTPAVGPLGGGTLVAVRGSGFPSGRDASQAPLLQVSFGGLPAASEDIWVVNDGLAYVSTPPGAPGTVDVVVTSSAFGTLSSAELADGFTYRTVADTFTGPSLVYDMHIDPTGEYLIAAAGSDGIQIFHRETGEKLSQIDVPGLALGVDSYFERGVDRLMVTTLQNGQGFFYVYNVDGVDLTQSHALDALELPGTLARGVDATNKRALVAMGNGGLGWIDIHLPGKAYLSQQAPLEGVHA
ncbi:MAG: IPT/TIG domain-containing protein, partial [Myxococcota bacterium]